MDSISPSQCPTPPPPPERKAAMSMGSNSPSQYLHTWPLTQGFLELRESVTEILNLINEPIAKKAVPMGSNSPSQCPHVLLRKQELDGLRMRLTQIINSTRCNKGLFESCLCMGSNSPSQCPHALLRKQELVGLRMRLTQIINSIDAPIAAKGPNAPSQCPMEPIDTRGNMFFFFKSAANMPPRKQLYYAIAESMLGITVTGCFMYFSALSFFSVLDMLSLDIAM